MSDTKNEQRKKPKIHEILAVEADLRKQYGTTFSQLKRAFTRPSSFEGEKRTYTPMADGDTNIVPDTNKPLVSTVSHMLGELITVASRHLDAVATKEASNQKATADVIVGDKVIIEGAPVQLLLNLENLLAEFIDTIESIPVLSPSLEWIEDHNHELAGTGKRSRVWKTREPEVKMRTQDVVAHRVIVPADEHQPAQVHKYTKTETIGTYHKNIFSGMMSGRDKNRLLERTREVFAEVKKARRRANSFDLIERSIADNVFTYILDD